MQLGGERQALPFQKPCVPWGTDSYVVSEYIKARPWRDRGVLLKEVTSETGCIFGGGQKVWVWQLSSREVPCASRRFGSPVNTPSGPETLSGEGIAPAYLPPSSRLRALLGW